MVSQRLEDAFTQLQLDTEDLVLETARMLKERYDKNASEVLDAIAAWWIRNDIKNLTDAQTHMDELMSKLDDIRDPFNEEYIESMTELFSEVYEFNYNHARTILEVEDDGEDSLLLFSLLGLSSIAWTADGVTYSERMILRNTQLKNSIRQIVLRVAVRGIATKSLMKLIGDELRKPKYRGTQILVDEANHFANEAVKRVGESDFDGYEISEILDGKTCAHCWSMHGRRYLWTEYDVGLTAPQFHCSCRGRIIPIGKLASPRKI